MPEFDPFMNQSIEELKARLTKERFLASESKFQAILSILLHKVRKETEEFHRMINDEMNRVRERVRFEEKKGQ